MEPITLFHTEGDRVVCEVCPRECHLGESKRGFCYVRQNSGGKVISTTYGKSTGFCIDPIEKKPLNQFYPGTPVLSFGTPGCNMGCRFCQNWTTTKSSQVATFCESASPTQIAIAASELGCKSVAYTYNDPVVWLEYARDTARECRERGLKNIAVTAGYITEKARPVLFEYMDAANVDLKAFTDDFYRRLCNAHIEPVLDTIRWLVHETDVWVELTNLVIPGENDSRDELTQMCNWIVEELGPDVPLHFSGFHPDFELLHLPPTPLSTLLMARDIAQKAGINYAYTGNVLDPETQATYCPSCGEMVIERSGYTIGSYHLKVDAEDPSGSAHCRKCGEAIAGHYGPVPGNWGSRRHPVQIGNYS